jgi:hypothetical protein
MKIVAAAAAVLLSGASGFAVAGSADEPRRPDGSTPLQWAVFNGNLAEAQRLLKQGADPQVPNNYGVNASAAGGGHRRHGADPGPAEGWRRRLPPPTPMARRRCTWWPAAATSRPRSC